MADSDDAKRSLERKGLRVSIVGALVMAVVGIGFALATRSDAIMLDGVFSAIGFLMALLTLRVASLAILPDDDRFHFGYSHFVPLLNVLKAVMMIVLCTFAFFSAVDSILSGGRSLPLGMAVLYGIAATIGCGAIALSLRRAAHKSQSVLVAVDYRSWMIDTLMSSAVLLSFVVGYFVSQTNFAEYVDYLDPGLVALLCLLALPIPFKTLLGNAREVLLYAPDPEITKEVERRVDEAIADIPHDGPAVVRLLKMGGNLTVLVHVILPEDFAIGSVQQLDDARSKIQSALGKMELRCYLDVVFTGDRSAAE